MVLQRLDELVQCQFQVNTAHESIVVVPVTALLARQGLDADAIHGLVAQAGTPQGIVDAQRALLVGAQDESRAKLLVVVTHCQLDILVVSLDIEMGNTPPLEIGLITWQRVFQELKPCTSIHILAAQVQIDIGIGQHLVLGMLGTDFFIIFRYQDIALDTAAHCHLGKSGQSCQQQDWQQ